MRLALCSGPVPSTSGRQQTQCAAPSVAPCRLSGGQQVLGGTGALRQPLQPGQRRRAAVVTNVAAPPSKPQTYANGKVVKVGGEFAVAAPPSPGLLAAAAAALHVTELPNAGVFKIGTHLVAARR